MTIAIMTPYATAILVMLVCGRPYCQILAARYRWLGDFTYTTYICQPRKDYVQCVFICMLCLCSLRLFKKLFKATQSG